MYSLPTWYADFVIQEEQAGVCALPILHYAAQPGPVKGEPAKGGGLSCAGFAFLLGGWVPAVELPSGTYPLNVFMSS